VRAGIAPPTFASVATAGLDHVALGPGSPAESWLSLGERARLQGLRLPKRRREWLAGRLAAKQAVCRRLGLRGPEAWPAIEIVSVRDGERRGRPSYTWAGRPGASVLSLAHAGGIALAALGEGDAEVGVDLEPEQAFDPAAESLLLAPGEARRLGGLRGAERRRALTWIWVLKEALAKALGVGLRLRLPDVEVRLDPRAVTPPAPEFLGAIRGPDGDAPRALAAQAFRIGAAQAAWVALAPGRR
jgi:phosphopantetheinyl transferase